MNLLNKYTLLLATLVTFTTAHAQDAWEKWGPTRQDGIGFTLRAGYTIGGTTPMPLPAEIRSINEFRPKGGGTIGAEAYKMFNKRWGLQAGLHIGYEGFHTGADVKNYRMSLTMEGNTMEGYFTGTDITNTRMWAFTIPVQATFRISPRWNVSVGPYFAVYAGQDFSGSVYDNKDGVGYLRVDTPTGEKVNIDRTNPATYDFSDNMRPWSGGLEFTFDWRATRKMNVFGMLDWAVSNIWQPDFEAVAFKMYPIYATLGVAYRY